MGNSDLVYLLFPFVLSVILVLTIILCCLKCKLLVDRPQGKTPSPTDDPGFGNLINIQEYAENQIGTTIVYADSPNSSTSHPYVYFSDGHTATIVPIQPVFSGSISCLSANRLERTASYNGDIRSSVSINSSHNHSSPPLPDPNTNSSFVDEGSGSPIATSTDQPNGDPFTKTDSILTETSTTSSSVPEQAQSTSTTIASTIHTVTLTTLSSQIQRASTNENNDPQIIPCSIVQSNTQSLDDELCMNDDKRQPIAKGEESFN